MKTRRSTDFLALWNHTTNTQTCVPAHGAETVLKRLNYHSTMFSSISFLLQGHMPTLAPATSGGTIIIDFHPLGSGLDVRSGIRIPGRTSKRLFNRTNEKYYCVYSSCNTMVFLHTISISSSVREDTCNFQRRFSLCCREYDEYEWEAKKALPLCFDWTLRVE